MTKTCSKCKQIKELSGFNKDSKRKDGLEPQCKTCKGIYKATYYEVNKDKEKAYRVANQDHKKVYNKAYRAANQDSIKASQKVWVAANQDHHRIYHRTYRSNRRETDLFYKFTSNLRSRIRNSLTIQGYSKSSKTCHILGESFDTVWDHLKQTWLNNYGTELQEYDSYHIDHIDHIVPMSSATSEEHALQLNHYLNLQLLTPGDNMKKGDRHVRGN